MSKSRFFCGGSVLAVTLVFAAGVQAAAAQQAAGTQPPVDDTLVTEVITTGTFIRGAAEDAALPVEVTTREELERQGNPTVNELVRNMSEIGNVQGEDNRGAGNDPGVGTINLRNMGSGRTLVLLNGQRLASQASLATNGETQDTTVIPVEALQQVEVLKDGGSTTYGSDAVAGVVNFRTRTDLNGMEASAAYEAIQGSDGDYNASVLWGRRNDFGNVLLSFGYDHRGELKTTERDFAVQPYLYSFSTNLPQGWTMSSNPGAYSFFTAPGAAATGPGGLVPPGSTGTATVVRANAAVAGLLADANGASSTAYPFYGTVRDPLCNQLGGYRGFSAIPAANLGGLPQTPVCFSNFLASENFVQTTDTYRLFGDSNFDVSEKWRVNVGFNFAKTVLPTRVYSGAAGLVQSGGAVAPCDPYDPFVTANAAAGQSRNCLPQTAGSTTLGQGVGFIPNTAATNYYVSGYNPALVHFLSTAAMTSIPGQRYFDDANVALVGSCQVGQIFAYVGGPSCAALGTNAPGRGQMRVTGNGTSLWSPFGAAGNPAFDDLRASERNENTSFSTTGTLRGELGEIFGNQVDMRVTGTYTRLFNDVSGKGILVDRLQRALNGFATNVNDRSGPGGTIDRCATGETLGQRQSSAGGFGPTNIPFTTGAGGGWGDANGATDGSPAYAGNGCYFFNPYASAIQNSVFGRTTYTNLVGNASTYGFVGTGQYQGYGNPNELTLAPNATAYTGAAGSGLQNDLGVINWMYENRYSRTQSDTLNVQLVFNGSGGFELPGGPLAWAVGGEYRYLRRSQIYDVLSDRQKNPCSFISTAAGTNFDSRAQIGTENDVNIPGRQALAGQTAENFSVTCNNINQTSPTISVANRTGVWLDGFGGTEFLRNNRVFAGFGELSIPLLDTLSLSLQSRYEQATGNSGIANSATVSSAAVRWDVTDKLILRASASQTFDATDCNCEPGLSSTANQGSTALITGTNLTVPRDAKTTRNTYGNVFLNPETGFNYSIGFIFRPTPSLELQMTLANIEVKGRPTTISANDLARVLVGRGSVGQSITDDSFSVGLDCGNPLFSQVDPSSGRPLIQLVGTDGTVVNACLASGTGGASQLTINGLDVTGADPDGAGAAAPVSATQDYALLFNVPNLANAANQSVRQLDISGAYLLPKTVLGGTTTVGADVSYLLFLNSDPGIYNGAVVDAGGKFAGTNGAPGGQQAVRFRGNLNLTWQKDVNTFTWTQRFLTAQTDVVGSTPVQAQSATAGHTNYNPAAGSVAACTTANIVQLIPDPRVTVAALGASGVGEGPYNSACNVGKYSGQKIDGSTITDVAYIRQLPADTRLSISVQNLFNIDPPFYAGSTQYFFASGGVTALGRVIKVGVTKKF